MGVEMPMSSQSVNAVSESATKRTMQDVLAKHKAVFQPELGTIRGFKAKIHIKSGADLVFKKA